MTSDWLDDLLNSASTSEDDALGGFYCPYTNSAECAVLARGWQPQELCEALECEQMKLVGRKRRPDRAA